MYRNISEYIHDFKTRDAYASKSIEAEAEISHLKYGCFTKALNLLKVYHKLLEIHHTGHIVCEAVDLQIHQPLLL